ncbi:MAG TPA: GTPase [Ignavibacteria bacterium]
MEDKDYSTLVEKRLERIASIYEYLDNLINDLPIDVPENIKKRIFDKLFGDKNMQEIIINIKERRAPRFVLMGKTGAGKSSLINAMFGKYLAKASDIEFGTLKGEPYSYKFLGKTIFEVVDTRGVGDMSEGKYSSSDVLKDTINKFSPDAILFLLKGDDRAFQDEEMKELKDSINCFDYIIKETKVPIIVIVNQVDKIDPSDEIDPAKYPQQKLDNINSKISLLNSFFKQNEINIIDIIPTSSFVRWNCDPDEVAIEKWSELKIIKDYRYNINKLLDVIENNIDLKARLMLMLYSRADKVVRYVSTQLCKAFTAVSYVIGLEPIPLADIFILTPLQIILIMLIAFLSGRELNFKSASEFLVSSGINVGFAYGLREAARAIIKLFIGPGELISASLAAAGTYSIGKAAIAYYLQGISKDDLAEVIKQAKSEYKRKNL